MGLLASADHADRRSSQIIVAAFVLLLCLGLVGGLALRSDSPNTLEASGSAPDATNFNVTLNSGRPLGPYGVGNRIEQIRGVTDITLAQELDPALSGSSVPLAVPARDGSFLLYNAWRTIKDFKPVLSMSQQGIQSGDSVGIPVVRLYDTQTKTDTVLVEGGYSPALSPEGKVAYLKGSSSEYRANVRYEGHVEVRSSLFAQGEPWTEEPARYVVAAWAGDRLLVSRQTEGGYTDLLVLDGPKLVRTLASNSFLIALSPDGERVIVARQGGWVNVVEIIHVGTGHKLSSLDVTGQRLTILPGGSWLGDMAVTGGGEGMLLFDLAGERVQLDRRISLPRRNENHFTLSQQQFLDASFQSVTAWGTSFLPDSPSSHSSIFVRCEIPTRECLFSPAIKGGLARWVENLSRP